MNNWKSNDFLMFKQLCLCFILFLFAPVTQAAFDGSAPVIVKSEPSDVILEQVSISDGNGGTWIAWIDGNGANDDELIISKINSVGTITRAATFLVSSPQTLSSLVLAVDETDAQSLYLAWTDNNNGGVAGKSNLFIARFNENFGSGAIQWNKEITSSSINDKENPDLVIANGDPIVAWTDFRSGIAQIRVTRLTTLSGVTVWSDRAVVTSAFNQNNASLAVGTGDINLFIVFTDEGVNKRIIATKTNISSGLFLQLEFIDLVLVNEIALAPTVIADNVGGIFVAWHQGVQSQPVSIYLRLFNSSLLNVGGLVTVANTGKDSNSVNYQMTSDKAAGVVLSWIDGRNASDDVYASKINSLLQPLWGLSGVRVTENNSSFGVSSPSILADSVGGAFVSYSLPINFFNDRGVRVKYIDPSTSSDPIGGFPSTSAGGSAILQPGTVNLVETTNGVVLSYVGTESSPFFPDKVFAQVFAGAIFPSRIETPIAVSPVANASLVVNTAFTLSASDFIMAGNGNHSSSNIEIRDSGDNVVISEQFNGASTDFNISQTLASNLLVVGESYSWRVRYTANTGETSVLSARETFIVVAASFPTITGLVNQSLDLSLGATDVSQSFTLSDPLWDVDDVIVTATSSDQSRVANSAISITGSGSDRSVTVSPTTGGTVTITVTVTSSGGLTTSSQYNVSVISAAVISGGLSDREILLGETTTLTFNIIDGDQPDLVGVEVVVDTSDISVIPASGLAINPPAVLNAPTTIDITPLGLGVADITITMTDSDGHMSIEQFSLTVVDEVTTSTPSSGGSSGGGGSVGLLFFLMFFAIRFMRAVSNRSNKIREPTSI